MRRLAALPVLALLAAPSFAGTVTGTVTVTDKGGRKASDLSDVVLWLEGGKAKVKPAPASMTMKGKAFLPHVVVVPVGSSVDFPNEDPIFHNAFSVSGENRFDLDLYKRPKSGTHAFTKPGVVRVYCNIHPQMSGVVVVADSAYYGKASADGTFTLAGVPAGKYLLKGWHERGGEASVEVTVPAGDGAANATLALDASAYKAQPHKNKFGKDYSSDEKY